jgi:hypothetical protein
LQKHASSEHLHLTTRRFFIGPIPEGWLSSNRKSWYKRRLELSNYSTRRPTFTATSLDVHRRTRTLSGFDGPSTAVRLGFSFPQPADVEGLEDEINVAETDDDEDAEVETREIEPLATNAEVPGIPDGHDVNKPKLLSAPSGTGLKPPSEARCLSRSKSPTQETYVTASEHGQRSFDEQDNHAGGERQQKLQPEGPGEGVADEEFHGSSSNRDDSLSCPGAERNASPQLEQTNSVTALLPRASTDVGSGAPASDRSKLTQRNPAPLADGEAATVQLDRTSTGVRFKLSEGIAKGQERIVRRVDSAQQRARNKFRHDTLQEGAIVKMEKMLVRIDTTLQPLPNDFDENDDMKTETRTMEKWQQFMIVVRRSYKDEADFRLQVYRTRVIPEIEGEKPKKRPVHEIYLNPRTTRVNLYSSLDKTIVIWHPYKKGTRIFILRPRSGAHAVEWYTFIRDMLGWARQSSLQVNVPDLSVSLKLEKPFAALSELQKALAETDENTALAKTIAEEQAVAGKIVKQCIEILQGDPEWSNMLETWSKTQKMGLAWKRYDRLEWIHGVQEQKMYGSMAMERSYDLELRPKQHYPTHAHGKEGQLREEPAPIEGFLIRLTSQKGLHQRLGRSFFKRLYFSTQNQFLIFNRPAKATPPHPPRLPTITGSNIPSSREIVRQTPTTFEIEPYPVQDGDVAWLSSGNREHVHGHDQIAFEEAQRNIENLKQCDGYINMVQIVKVRRMKWGATEGDEGMEEGSGSDVEFHQDVGDTMGEDGETKKLDDERVFELVLENGLVVRLQAYSQETRKEWISRLRKLVTYWKLRTKGDMDTFKAVRKHNLEALNIDEEMEAIVGQFARKWEVRQSKASPQLYNMCPISGCRTISMSGLLYRKPRRHSTFQRCGVILAGGQLLLFHAAMRKMTGEPVRHIQQERQQAIGLKDCYVYSGLITEDDLLYQNQTFDANHPGMHPLPRVYREDGWTSQDEDTMTCFVVWHGLRKSLFRAVVGEKEGGGGTRQKLRQVSRLGTPGRSIVFMCRSRAERDHWVMSVGTEIDRLQQQHDEEVRVERHGEK